MNILFFTKGDRTIGSSRLRVWQVADTLYEQRGVKYEVIYNITHSFFSLAPARFRALLEIYSKIQNTKYQILFIHKSLFPWDVVLLILAARFFLRKRLIYDLDDAEWVHSFVKSWLFIKSAHAVFCGSHPILDWIKRYTRRAVFVPTVVDAELYKSFSVEHTKREKITIGWIGMGRGHFQDGHFSIIKPVLDELLRRGCRFRFVIIGSQNYQPLKDYFKQNAYEVIFIDELNWADAAAVPRAIHQYQFDIGVMPISDTPFNRAKCAFKAIECMACGVPPVASRVGEAEILIENGVNGYLAKTTEEWVSATEKLMRDANVRKIMGMQAQNKIGERYSYQSIIPRILSMIQEICKT